MYRTPNCDYLTQTKHPQANNGIAEYNCSKFKWTETTFNEVIADSNIETYERNEDLFRQCLTCPYNKQNSNNPNEE